MTKLDTNAEAALAYLIARRDRLAGEIELMRGRMTEIDYLISELSSPVGARAVPVVSVPVARVAAKAMRGRTSDKFDGVLTVIRRQGIKGMTGHQLAAAQGIPYGTATSRLCLMKKAGLVVNHSPLWFVAEGRVNAVPVAEDAA